jgi:hypothetical protein
MRAPECRRATWRTEGAAAEEAQSVAAALECGGRILGGELLEAFVELDEVPGGGAPEMVGDHPLVGIYIYFNLTVDYVKQNSQCLEIDSGHAAEESHIGGSDRSREFERSSVVRTAEVGQ